MVLPSQQMVPSTRENSDGHTYLTWLKDNTLSLDFGNHGPESHGKPTVFFFFLGGGGGYNISNHTLICLLI